MVFKIARTRNPPTPTLMLTIKTYRLNTCFVCSASTVKSGSANVTRNPRMKQVTNKTVILPLLVNP